MEDSQDNTVSFSSKAAYLMDNQSSTYDDRINPILLALLSYPHPRDVRIVLQVQYLVDEWCHGPLRPNWVPRLDGVPELVELVGWDEAGVATSLPDAQNGHRLSEVLADHIDEGHPFLLDSVGIHEVEASVRSLPGRLEDNPQRVTVHKKPLRVAEALRFWLVALAWPIGVPLWLREQAGHQLHPALLLIDLPRVVAKGYVHRERRVFPQAVQGGFVDVHDDGNHAVCALIGRIRIDLCKKGGLIVGSTKQTMTRSSRCGRKSLRRIASCMHPQEAKKIISLGTPSCLLVHDVIMHTDTSFYRRLKLCPPGPSGGMVILSLLHDFPVWPLTDLSNSLDNGLDFKPVLSRCRVGT
jgi:hypothetical protein